MFPVDFGRPAAAKILAEDVSVESERYIRFRNEYQKLITLPYHPGLIHLYHFDLAELADMRLPLILMEKCECSLAQLAKSGSIPASRIKQIITSLCKSLGYIHANGIVHRDIKPENILIRADGSVVLADFGIAWFDPQVYQGEKLTKKGDRLANFNFSAPEQLNSEKQPIPASDIYALGQICYWLVTGEVIRGVGFRRISEIDPKLGFLDVAVSKMVQQNPNDRPVNCQEIIQIINNSDESSEKLKWYYHVLNCIGEFELRLRSSLPGHCGISHVTEQSSINRVLESVATECSFYELNWIRGYTDAKVETMFRMENGIWVIGGIELNVTDLWVGRRSTGIDHCFILLRSDPMPPFDVYKSNLDRNIHETSLYHEEVGWFHKHYIPIEHCWDGFTYENDLVIPIDQWERRNRYQRPFYLFLSSRFNPIQLAQRSDSDAPGIINKLIEAIEEVDSVVPGDLEQLFKLPRHEGSLMLD